MINNKYESRIIKYKGVSITRSEGVYPTFYTSFASSKKLRVVKKCIDIFMQEGKIINQEYKEERKTK